MSEIALESKDYKHTIEYAEYALNNCDFNDDDDLTDAYEKICLGYYYLGESQIALEYCEQARERGSTAFDDDFYDSLVKMARSDKIFNTVDKVAANPIVQNIPYVGLIAKKLEFGKQNWKS